jgi:hypothetical protein
VGWGVLSFSHRYSGLSYQFLSGQPFRLRLWERFAGPCLKDFVLNSTPFLEVALVPACLFVRLDFRGLRAFCLVFCEKLAFVFLDLRFIGALNTFWRLDVDGAFPSPEGPSRLAFEYYNTQKMSRLSLYIL